MSNFIATTQFLCCMQTPSKTAEGIFLAVKVVFEQLKLDWKKVIVLCCDGDSTLLGKESGLIAKLQNLNKCILPIHCMAHRSALVVSSVAKGDAVKRIDS